LSVLDANAIIAFLMNEPAADQVEELMRSSTTLLASVTVAEVYDQGVRTKGFPSDELDAIFETLARDRRFEIMNLDGNLARRAGSLRATHYDRATRPVSMADCVVAATAERWEYGLATSDTSLIAMAREIGLEVIALPDSSGRRP